VTKFLYSPCLPLHKTQQRRRGHPAGQKKRSPSPPKDESDNDELPPRYKEPLSARGNYLSKKRIYRQDNGQDEDKYDAQDDSRYQQNIKYNKKPRLSDTSLERERVKQNMGASRAPTRSALPKGKPTKGEDKDTEAALKDKTIVNIRSAAVDASFRHLDRIELKSEIQNK
jgi:hypothetical protein